MKLPFRGFRDEIVLFLETNSAAPCIEDFQAFWIVLDLDDFQRVSRSCQAER